MNTNSKAFYLLIIGFFGILLLPYFVTQFSLLNIFNINFGNSHEIGDMIGGITSPFISLISAALVYLTIKEQINANSLINSQFIKQENSRIENELLIEFDKNLMEVKNDLNAVYVIENHKMPPENKLVGEYAIKETIFKTIYAESTFYYNEEIIKICNIIDRFLEFSNSSRYEIKDYYRFLNFYSKISNFIEKYFPLKSENEEIPHFYINSSNKNVIYFRKLVELYSFYKEIYFKLSALHKLEIEKEGKEISFICKEFTFFETNFKPKFDSIFLKDL